ncbi:uncharacterized protein L201_003333 [Kwoniella dendrophila CBS 6074]|uniref:YTH domain-containing protein n=1 Tax=Kwoniella dendrophila CBS 6074 TaxID=1295534 RepID=A0AAX4JV25_9TREE
MNSNNPDRPPSFPSIQSRRISEEDMSKGPGVQYPMGGLHHPLQSHEEELDADLQNQLQNLHIDSPQPPYHRYQPPPEEQPYQPYTQNFYPPQQTFQHPAYSYSPYAQQFPNPSIHPVAGQYGIWTSPPMSPAVSSNAFQPPPLQHGSGREFGSFHGTPRGSYSNGPNSAWTSPSIPSSFGFYTPYQQQQATMEARPNEWTQSPSNHQSQASRRNNRQSWSGPSRGAKEAATLSQEKEKEKERKAYHPLAPARRSDWVIPSNTSHEELWRYFNNTVPLINPDTDNEPWRGPSSIFLISRSSCAFVNLSSQTDLDRAVAFFNGKSLRPWDPRCPRMLCRIRRKDDDLRSGVGAQRGTGMHRAWVKEQAPKLPRQISDASVSSATSGANSVPPSPAILEHPPEGEGRRRESVIKEGVVHGKHQSSGSFASTNSSFLTKNFPRRVFILKKESVQTGTWKTQRHNEPILDQAFRTSQEVFLIFGANRSGEFFGFAKMIEPIGKEKAKRTQSAAVPLPRRPTGTDSETRPPFFLTPSQSHIAASSPGEITPGEEGNVEHALGARRTDPSDIRNRAAHNNKSIQSAPEYRAQTLDPKALQHDYFPPVPATNEEEADHQEQLGGSERQPTKDDQGVLRKDTVLTPDEKAEREEEEGHDEFMEESRGHIFRIEWVKVAPIAFNKTRHLRNPWNSDREVKVSRDGTEVEPTIGSALMEEWDKLVA